jgi:hypothetical protein
VLLVLCCGGVLELKDISVCSRLLAAKNLMFVARLLLTGLELTFGAPSITVRHCHRHRRANKPKLPQIQTTNRTPPPSPKTFISIS